MGSGASAAHTIPGFTGYSGFNYGELSDNAARVLYPKHNQESKIEVLHKNINLDFYHLQRFGK